MIQDTTVPRLSNSNPVRAMVFTFSMMCSLAVVALPVHAETLAKTLEDTYVNSGLLDQNRALLRAADENVASTVAGLRPIVNWTADLTQNFSRIGNEFTPIGGTGPTLSVNNSSALNATLSLSFSLLLYDFGQTSFQIESVKETVLATRETLRSVEQQLLLRAIQAYLNVRRNEEFVSLRANNMRLLEEELRAANDRFEVGEVTRTDVAQAEARLASARGDFADAEGDLVQSKAEFRAAVGRKPGRLQPPGELPRLSTNIEKSVDIAVRNHPDIIQVQHEVSAADLLINAAEAAVKPQVNFNSQVSLQEEVAGPEFNRNGSFGIQISGPIYQGGLLSSAIRQAQAQRDSSRGQLHVVRRNIIQGVGNAYAIYEATQAQRVASQEQVRAAQVAFDGVREEAKLGARTTLDVLDAEQELLDAKANLISSDADVYIAAYSVLSSIGQLTARDLKLNVRLYDPAAYYNLVKKAPTLLSPEGKKLDRVLRALGKD